MAFNARSFQAGELVNYLSLSVPVRPPRQRLHEHDETVYIWTATDRRAPCARLSTPSRFAGGIHGSAE